MAWLESLCDGRAWDQQRDTPRIRAAFLALAKGRRTWPAPVDFIEAMPRLAPQRALSSKSADPERAKAAIAECVKALGVRR